MPLVLSLIYNYAGARLWAYYCMDVNLLYLDIYQGEQRDHAVFLRNAWKMQILCTMSILRIQYQNLNAHIPLKNAFALATQCKEFDTNNMKCTWPTRLGLSWRWVRQAWHWVRQAWRWVRQAWPWLLGYQHVGISNGKWSRWGSKPKQWPSVSGFALQWNIS